MERGLRWKRSARRPRGLQRARRLHRLPRLLAHHADEVLLDDDPDEARHAAHRALVDVLERRADGWRSYDRAVHHARHAYVVHEIELASHHRSHVEARDRSAEYLPLARRLARCRRIHRDVERSAGNEISVADALG